jgi:aspartyl-tRNA(Asn)/glutamyl-tRNA(Gln) amidotransferase subunit A
MNCRSLPATIATFRDAVRSHTLSPEEFLIDVERRVRERDSTIGAFLSTRFPAARSEVGRTDSATLLAGAPVAIKDILMMAGERCTCGSRILQDFVAPYTATSVLNLQKAGGVVVGKTNLDEFAMGSSTENSAFFPTHNPVDLSRVPGGSSGGSAAAVAAGFALAALGTDTGGSVRQPAALCGIVGFKPTYGAVSRYGLVAFASSLDHVCPFTTSVRDAAIMMNAIAGHDPLDATSVARAPADFEAALAPTLKGKRIGVVREIAGVDVQREIGSAFDSAVHQAELAGALVTEVSIPHLLDALSAYYIIAPAECSANLGRFDGVRYGLRVEGKSLTETYSRTRDAGFGPEVKRRILIGAYVLSAGYYDAFYRKATEVRQLLTDEFNAAFQAVDVLLTPTTPSTAFKLGAVTDPLEMYKADVFTIPANLTGMPGISFPAGTDAQGLPIGLQITGPQWSDADVLSTANVLSLALGGMA